MTVKLFRVILPVSTIQAAADFYERALGIPGSRVSEGRHYFHCGGTILACFSPREDGDAFDLPPNPDHLYFSVDDLEATFARCQQAGCKRLDEQIRTRPWGERSFYAEDPFGNKLCFVDETTAFTGNRP
jgi:catechol 2,3-dioxygenase-like lactoylglutathione lyase family enzyme